MFPSGIKTCCAYSNVYCDGRFRKEIKNITIIT